MVNSIQGQFGAGGMRPMGGPPPRRDVLLTDEQKQQVQDILSNYDPEKITEDDAKEIFSSFKEAGIQPGRDMKEVIEAAGFDAEELRSMGMPEPQSGGMNGPQGNPSMFRIGNNKGVDTAALQTLQTILNQYDLSELSEDQEGDLLGQLEKAGLLYPGSTVDIQS